MKNLGTRLKAKIKENGHTQHSLALLLGVTDSEISRYVSGERMPSLAVLVSLADNLNTTTDYLLGREGC